MEKVLLCERHLSICHVLDVHVHLVKLQEHSLFEFQELLGHSLLLVRQLLGDLLHTVPDERQRLFYNDCFQIVHLNTVSFCHLSCLSIEHLMHIMHDFGLVFSDLTHVHSSAAEHASLVHH